jgi:hypothetical protein
MLWSPNNRSVSWLHEFGHGMAGFLPEDGGSVRRLVDGSFFFVFMGIGALFVLRGDERRVAIDRHFV